MPLQPGKARLIRRHYIIPNERVILETHPSRWFYFVAPLFLTILIVAFIYLIYARGNTALPFSSVLKTPTFVTPGLWLIYLEVAATILVLIDVGLTSWRLYLWAAQTYAVTDERLVQQKGIIRHEIEEIPLQQVRDVIVFQKSFWARYLLRAGTLRIQSLSQLDFSVVESNSDQGKVKTGPPFTTVHSKFDLLRDVIDPKIPLARESGIEWWVGVPNPFRIEREIELATRALTHPTPPQTRTM